MMARVGRKPGVTSATAPARAVMAVAAAAAAVVVMVVVVAGGAEARCVSRGYTLSGIYGTTSNVKYDTRNHQGSISYSGVTWYGCQTKCTDRSFTKSVKLFNYNRSKKVCQCYYYGTGWSSRAIRGDGFSSAQIKPCPECNIKQYGSRKGGCQNCSSKSCLANYWRDDSTCRGITAPTCRKHKTCSSLEYQTKAPTKTSDRVCTKCKTCAAGTYKSGGCSGTANTRCSTCSGAC